MVAQVRCVFVQAGNVAKQPIQGCHRRRASAIVVAAKKQY
jgi:hypothetical protein